LELIDTMVEKGQIEEIGKKTVMKGEDYFGGGKKFNLKQELESRNPTTFESATGKIKPKDETIIYGVSKKTIPVDKTAFAQTMKESNLLRDIGNPLNKKPTVPKGVDEPAGQYHAFIGESKSVGGTFRGTRISLGSGKGVTGVVTSTGITKPTYPSFPVNKFTGTKVNVGSGDATSTKVSQSKVIPALPVNKFTENKVSLGSGSGLSNIKDVRGLSTKPDVVGITTSKINVKKFNEPKIEKGDTVIDGEKGSLIVKNKIEGVVKPLGKTKINSPYKSAQVQVPKVKASVKPPKVSPKIKQIVTPNVIQGQETGSVLSAIQKTSQKQVTKQQPKLKQVKRVKQMSRLTTGTALVTGLQTKTAQVQMTAMKTPPVFNRITTKKRIIIIVPIPEPESKSTRRTKRGNKAGFIGNVRLDNVMGMYKRKEITYGAKKVTKLERQDARLTSGTSNRIAQPASGLLKTKKKKKEKKTSVFGGGKDEFKGFGSKKKGKKKSSLFG